MTTATTDDTGNEPGRLARYRARPVEIRAVQWRGDKAALEQFGDRVSVNPDGSATAITPHGAVIAMQGDWIIVGTADELYPCIDAIFRAKYERVPS